MFCKLMKFPTTHYNYVDACTHSIRVMLPILKKKDRKLGYTENIQNIGSEHLYFSECSIRV